MKGHLRRLERADARRVGQAAPVSDQHHHARLSAALALQEPERSGVLVRLHREGLHDGPPPSPQPTPAQWRARFAGYERESRFARDPRWRAALRG